MLRDDGPRLFVWHAPRAQEDMMRATHGSIEKLLCVLLDLEFISQKEVDGANRYQYPLAKEYIAAVAAQGCRRADRWKNGHRSLPIDFDWTSLDA